MAEAPAPGGSDVLLARLAAETHDAVTVDAAQVVASIKAGECDQAWGEVLAAVRERVRATDTGLRWRVDLDDLHVAQEDFTLDEARMVQRVTGQSWLMIDPISDANATLAVLTALFYTRLDLSLEEAMARARNVPMMKAHAALSQYVEPRPFDSTSTTVSPPAPASSNGRRRSPRAQSSVI